MDFYVYNTIHKQLGDADETKSVSPFSVIFHNLSICQLLYKE